MTGLAPDIIALRTGALSAEVGTEGARLLGLRARTLAGDIPLLRDGAGGRTDPLRSSGFPLVPFGNRVRDNRFQVASQTHVLAANTAWDRHYLHGDGWLARWSVVESSSSSVRLRFSRQASASSPYCFTSEMTVSLSEDALTLTLQVQNDGAGALPFGLGFHPYFPLTEQTTLTAAATGFFPEEAEFLPGRVTVIPDDVSFERARMLPRRWINNAFSGWDGVAAIDWPERGACLRMTASPVFSHYVVFMSDTRFEPDFASDYFCFEPMTHAPDGHNATDGGGLVLLAPGETLSGTLRMEIAISTETTT